MIGLELTDERFFSETVDTSQPGLCAIPGLVSQGDYATARRVFAADVRPTHQPDRFPCAPGESLADAVERILNLNLISCGTPHQIEGDIDWFANPPFNQCKEWTSQLSHHWEWELLAARLFLLFSTISASER